MNKNKKILGLILALVMAIGLTACGNKEVEEVIDSEEGVEVVDREYSEVIIEHELGETKITEKPSKIVVFDYGLLDIIENLDEDIIGLPKATLPKHLSKYESEDYTDVGSLKEPNLEKIFEIKPDLIIISGRQADMYDEFSKIANTVYLPINGQDYFNSFEYNVNSIANIFGKEEIAEEKIDNIKNSIEELNEKVSKEDKNGLFIMANDGNLSAYGPDSRFGMIHKEFGITPVDENIEDTSHGQKISFEYILEKNPDYLFVMDRAAVVGGDVSAKQVLDNDIIKSTKAYENDNIIYLDADVWYISSGGITGTEMMIKEISDNL